MLADNTENFSEQLIHVLAASRGQRLQGDQAPNAAWQVKNKSCQQPCIQKLLRTPFRLLHRPKCRLYRLLRLFISLRRTLTIWQSMLLNLQKLQHLRTIEHAQAA